MKSKKKKPVLEVKFKFHKKRFKQYLIKYLHLFEREIREFSDYVKESLRRKALVLDVNSVPIKKVSVIIPAYNEEKRILKVVKPSLQSKFVGEVIVVDDGSKDNTAKVVREFKERHKHLGKKLILISQKNKGKAGAMETGVNASKYEYVLFLDADLIGLKVSDIDKLIMPVISELVDVTISLRKNSLGIFKMLNCDFISGERCMKKSLLNGIWKDVSGFGIEVVMNKRILKKHLKIASISISAKNTVKAKKQGVIKGLKSELKMISEIFENVNPFLVFQQLILMSSLQYKIIFEDSSKNS
ncbi:MAG: glycosyltransferase family 2 protein [Candidatus Woesearchaeota archaeon]